MQLRGVLFDLDDTLIDHRGAVARALRAWLPALDDSALTVWNAAQERHLVAWRERRISFAEQRRRRLRDFLPAVGIEFADDDLDQIFEGYLREYEAAWAVFPDVEDALTTLAGAGLVTAVLTNGTTEQQNDKLARVGLAGRVGPVFTVEDLGVAKPDPAAFRTACARWGLDPAAVLSVGDRHDLDVLPARLAGLRAVHLDRHHTGPPDEPARITTLRDLRF
ncbi:HAD family hydrolase [Micromonosporaceae bacterium Da 78-11]